MRPYIIEVMRHEWAYGRDIGETEVLLEVGRQIGLDPEELAAAITDRDNLEQLERNAREAADASVIGVPSFVIGDQIFWGQDRIDFVLDELREMRASKL